MASGRKQKPTTNDLMMMRPGLRAQIPDSPSLTLSSRGPPHYINAGYENTDSFTGSHYEDLEHYNQIPACPRKTNNSIYQNAGTLNVPPQVKIERQRQYTECSDDSTSSLVHSNSKNSRCSMIILGLILFVSVVALLLVILMIFGIIKPSTNNCGCDTTTSANNKRFLTTINRASTSTSLLDKRINRLERNMSLLVARDTIMSSLVLKHQKEILELKSKLGDLKEESSTNNFKQNITTEVKNLREKQVQFDSSLTILKASDKTKTTEIQEISAKVVGLAVAVKFLSLNDSLIKSKVHKLSQSEVEFRSSIEALEQKDAEVDTSLKRAKSVEAFLNSSVNQLKSIDGQIMNELNQMNTTFMTKINKMQGGTGKPGAAGPPGPQGPRGIPGTPGAGNLSQCEHRQKESTATSGASAKESIFFIEPKDKKVLGATCSTIRGDETNLSTITNSSGEKVYSCECKGFSNVHNASGNLQCFIDVWVCPRIS